MFSTDDLYNTDCNNVSMIFITLTHLLSIPVIKRLKFFQKMLIIYYITSDFFYHKFNLFNKKYLINIHFFIISVILLYTLLKSIQLAKCKEYIGIYFIITYGLNYLFLRLNSNYACYIEPTIHIHQWLGLLYLLKTCKNKKIIF